MKITEKQLRSIIKEELQANVINESALTKNEVIHVAKEVTEDLQEIMNNRNLSEEDYLRVLNCLKDVYIPAIAKSLTMAN